MVIRLKLILLPLLYIVKKMNKYKYVLFDLDGTLMDTSDGILKSIDYTINKCGYHKLSLEIKKNFIGPPIKNSFMKTYDLKEEEANKATTIFREAYKNEFLLFAKVYDGIIQLLQSLRLNNVKIGVATYKRDDYAKKLLEKFEIADKCDFILGSDMNNKLTKTDIVKLCLKNLGCDNLSEAILIGDTYYDAIGAKECGINFIAVTYGFGFKKTAINSFPAIFIADTVKDIEFFLVND